MGMNGCLDCSCARWFANTWLSTAVRLGVSWMFLASMDWRVFWYSRAWRSLSPVLCPKLCGWSGWADAGKNMATTKMAQRPSCLIIATRIVINMEDKQFGDKWLKLGCMLSTFGAKNRTLHLNCSCFSQQIRDTAIVTPVADTKFCTYGISVCEK